MMRILITNDDGIKAEGLLGLVKWACKYGEVTVCAPLHEQSGKSQGIESIHLQTGSGHFLHQILGILRRTDDHRHRIDGLGIDDNFAVGF